MAYIVKQTTPEKFLPKLKSMTMYDVYLNTVRGAIEPIRYTARGMSYFPPQLGGLTGQRTALSDSLVMQVIDFEVN